MKKADPYGITIEEDGEKFNIVYLGENGKATLASCWDYLLAEDIRDTVERYLGTESNVISKEISTELDEQLMEEGSGDETDLKGLYAELLAKYTSGGKRVDDVFIDFSNGQIIMCLDKQVYVHYANSKGVGFEEANERFCREVMEYVEGKYPGQFYLDWSKDEPMLSIEEKV